MGSPIDGHDLEIILPHVDPASFPSQRQLDKKLLRRRLKQSRLVTDSHYEEQAFGLVVFVLRMDAWSAAGAGRGDYFTIPAFFPGSHANMILERSK